MSGFVRSTATVEHPSEHTGIRTALATVCISGTLEDKLAAVAPDAVADLDRLAAQLHAAAERAAAHGMRIAYEALAWGTHISTYEQSWEAVRRADHPALGLCLDSFHILSRGSDPAGITEIPAEKLFFLQLADAPHMNMDVLQWSRHHRLFPGQGAWD